MSTGILMLIGGTATFSYEKNNKIKSIIVTTQQFQVYLNNWQSVNPVDEILTLSQQQIPTSINSEITAYSFDRVVVCDRDEIANLLIANNFHFENNCAVLSIDGYPQNIFATVMQMLRRNPDLKVYLLHDASPKGLTVVNTLINSHDWFLNTSVTIYDIGLLPRQVFNNSNIFTQISEDFATEAKELLSEVKQNLTEKEIKWLEAGKFVELESFTPQKLLRVITQGIAKSRRINSNDSSSDSGSGVIGDNAGTFDSCDITIYADDCFG